jgi:hypothetical protein
MSPIRRVLCESKLLIPGLSRLPKVRNILTGVDIQTAVGIIKVLGFTVLGDDRKGLRWKGFEGHQANPTTMEARPRWSMETRWIGAKGPKKVIHGGIIQMGFGGATRSSVARPRVESRRGRSCMMGHSNLKAGFWSLRGRVDVEI